MFYPGKLPITHFLTRQNLKNLKALNVLSVSALWQRRYFRQKLAKYFVLRPTKILNCPLIVNLIGPLKF